MPVLPLIISSEWLCFSPQDTPVRISRSSLFWSVLLIWRLGTLLLWVMNNTLLFLIRALCANIGLVWAPGAGSREWFQLGVSQHQRWFPACPTKPQLILWGAWTSAPAPLTRLFWVTAQWEEDSLLNKKSCFQVTFGHLVIILLCISHCKMCSAFCKPSAPVAIPGLRTSWHPRTGSQLYQRQTSLLHQFTPP